MAGPVTLIIVLVAVIPVAVLMSGGIASGLLGWLVKSEADKNHEGSELLKTNN
jgi:hypothetical protein